MFATKRAAGSSLNFCGNKKHLYFYVRKEGELPALRKQAVVSGNFIKQTVMTIRKIIDRVISGEVRIPAFQRNFVWSPNQVAFLLDSIYKNFPIGTVFLWKTHERLETEKTLVHLYFSSAWIYTTGNTISRAGI